MLENTPTQSTMTELLDNLCLQSGKSCVQRLMKNTIWNGYGIQAVRTGFMNISTAEAVKRFAVYMRKRIALVL